MITSPLDSIPRKIRLPEIGRKLKLSRPHPVSGLELAKEFNVTTKTIERDIVYMIDHLGWRIDSKRGNKGGYILNNEPRQIDNLKINAEQIFFLSIIKKVIDSYKNTPIKNKFKPILNQIHEIYGDGFFEYTRRIDDKIFIKTTGEMEYDETIWHDSLIPTLTETPIEIKFREVFRNNKVSKRTLDPYAIIYQDQGWYLLANDRNHNKLRTFAIWRILKVTKLENESFTPIPLESIKDRINNSSGIDQADEEIDVKIIIDPSRKELFKERVWFKNQKFTKSKNDDLIFSFNTTGQKSLLKWILGNGEYIEVIEPLWLRDQVKDIIQKSLNKYK